MKKIFLSISLIFLISLLKSQSVAQSVYFEIGGPGLLSFNIDSRFSKKDDGLGGRIGIGGFQIGDTGVVLIPIGINYLIKHSKRNYFEIGIGYTPIHEKNFFDKKRITLSQTLFWAIDFSLSAEDLLPGYLLIQFLEKNLFFLTTAACLLAINSNCYNY